MHETQELSIFVRTGKLPMRWLETARLQLRPFCQDDWKHVSEWEEGFQNVNRAQTFLDFCHDCYQKWGIGPWALVVKQTGVVAGNCGFVRIHFIGNSGEVSYYIRPSHRSCGFASEALKAVLTYGFVDLDLNRIQARCAPDNSASQRVMQRTQMEFERVVVSNSGFDDRASQNKLYAIMRNEFKRTEPVNSAPEAK
jgi:ribosomal-protein-alanine N-acetyltransferase